MLFSNGVSIMHGSIPSKILDMGILATRKKCSIDVGGGGRQSMSYTYPAYQGIFNKKTQRNTGGLHGHGTDATVVV